ncbi:MAG: hypothetical protein IPF79_09080 [Ignavibacteria bacterium]|nr:hypothetical protein [Ignavibacteria bacterium]
MKIVVVFVDFADDTYAPNSPEWPIGQAPIWVNNGSLFTPTAQYSEVAFNPEPRSVSDYFWQMSQKSFDDGLRIYGDCFYVQFPKTRQQVFDQNITIDDATTTVVGILDNQIDFATYDRWTSRERFQHNYAPDGVVDLFVIVWRNLVKDLVANTPFRSGLEARGFGVKSAVGLAVNPVPGNEMPRLLPVDNGARSIYTEWAPYAANGFWQPYGASIHMMNWLSDIGGALVHTRSNGIYDGVFRELIHEIGHHLHGHHRQSGAWSVLSVSDSRSYAMSAAELIDLGWIEPVIIRKSGTVPENIQLGDLYTTGDVLAIEVESLTNPLNVDKSTPEGLYNSSEGSKWYFVENHQMISPYDFTIGRLPVWGSSESTARGASRGLYITYNEDQIGFARQHVQSASGEFMWNNDRNATFWGRSNFPVFERLEQTRSDGSTHSEQIPLATPRDFGGPVPLSVFPVYLMWQGGTAVEKQLSRRIARRPP